MLGDDAEVRELDSARWRLDQVSRTFHGRDLFSPAAAALASGTPVTELGTVVEDWLRPDLPRTRALPDGALETDVLFADHFGNLITSLRSEELDSECAWSVEVAGRVLPLVSTYSETSPGGLIGLFGSSGTLEVSVRNGSAERELGLGRGAGIRLRKVPS